MSSTYPRVEFGLFGLDIKQDGTITASDQQSFSKMKDLKTDNVAALPYATYEPNFWLLDGKYKFMPADDSLIHIGLISASMSNGSGIISTPPVVTINFSSVHSSDGLVLRFGGMSDDYANSITVKYYDASNALILSKNYSPDSWEYDMDFSATGFKKIEITFFGTNKPYRYLRLTGIDFGQLISFEKTDVEDASMVEEINPLSTEISINTCELKLFSDDEEFAITNPSGYYSRLSKRQPLSIYEIVDGAPIFLGRFFLDEWKNSSSNEIEFSCIDYIGILDKTTYKGGIWLDGTKLSQNLIEEIMDEVSVPYDLDPDLYNIPIIGWIPIGSHRKALQQVAVSIGAYVDTSRQNQIKIYKTTLASVTPETAEITDSDKANEETLELKQLVTGVEITSHSYIQGTEIQKLYSGTLAAGTYEIDFNQPIHSLSITGGTISESGANYAIIAVAAAGAVELTGLNYIDTTRVFSAYLSGLDSNTTPNIVTVNEATLVSTLNGSAVAARVFAYYQQRYKYSIRMFASFQQPGVVALVDSMNGRKVRGVVERIENDLTGGFIQDLTVSGVINGLG